MIPAPRTLHEFDIGEFSAEPEEFSSFAYLVEVFLALTRAVEDASEESPGSFHVYPYESLAVAIEGWSLLLPESKKAAHLKEGVADELMFQAHMNVFA